MAEGDIVDLLLALGKTTLGRSDPRTPSDIRHRDRCMPATQDFRQVEAQACFG